MAVIFLTFLSLIGFGNVRDRIIGFLNETSNSFICKNNKGCCTHWVALIVMMCDSPIIWVGFSSPG